MIPQRATRALTLTGLFWLIGATPASAQRLPLSPGNVVRVASLDSASQDLWLTGHIVTISRDSMALLAPAATHPSIRQLSDQVVLQVRRTSPAGGIAGFLGGMAVGAVSGATYLSGTLSEPFGHWSRAAEVGGIGLAAGLVGLLLDRKSVV